jgi:hypothetical protein
MPYIRTLSKSNSRYVKLLRWIIMNGLLSTGHTIIQNLFKDDKSSNLLIFRNLELLHWKQICLLEVDLPAYHHLEI